eukprot:1142267-Pyramimonas_sp.AAC.1
MLALKVAFPDCRRASSESCGRPQGCSADLRGFRRALLKVVQGVPSQMPMTARDRIQPSKIFRTQ